MTPLKILLNLILILVSFEYIKKYSLIYYILGEKPNPIKGTKGIVKLNESVQRFEEGKHWSIKLLNVQEKTISLEVGVNYITHDATLYLFCRCHHHQTVQLVYGTFKLKLVSTIPLPNQMCLITKTTSTFFLIRGIAVKFMVKL